MRSNNTEDYGMNLPTAMVIASFTTIAWVNTIELQIRIWLGFRRYTGLYFWSLLLASWGCALHPLGFVMLDFGIWTDPHATGVVIGVGWWWMVTGQALVLYSRLHLVVRDARKIRWVLIMIITNFFILHIPIMLLSQVGYSNIPSAPKWLQVYNIYEKIQMTGFTIQETIISGLYLWETRKILRPGRIFQKEKTRAVMYHLIWVNVVIIMLDMALLSTEYANLFSIQTVFKAAIYSLKLRFEFVVLNQLMEVVQGRSSAFDLSNNPSNGYGASRTARSVRLDDMNRRSTHKQVPEGLKPPGNSYSVTASKGSAGPVDSQKVDGVMRTTEVHIHGSPTPHQEQQTSHDIASFHPHEGMGSVAHARTLGVPPSPTSSEVEFAGKGF